MLRDASQRGPSAWMATCDIRAAMLLSMRPEQRSMLFAISCPLPHPLPSPFLPSARRAGCFSFPPRSRRWGAPAGASDACEASGFACHDRHAGACEAPRVPSDGDARLAALHRGDFRPGPVLAVVRHSLRDRAATLFAARVI